MFQIRTQSATVSTIFTHDVMIYSVGLKVENKLIFFVEKSHWKRVKSSDNKSSGRTLFTYKHTVLLLSVFLQPRFIISSQLTMPFLLWKIILIRNFILCLTRYDIYNEEQKYWGNCILCSIWMDIIQHTLPEEKRNLITVVDRKIVYRDQILLSFR